jgi:predicted dehydrogenase
MVTTVGFVGAGGVASRHAAVLSDFGDVRIAAVADPDLARAEQLAAPFGAAVYASAPELLAGEQLDALYICVPPFAHGEPELAAIQAGLPFFVEKPVALDLKTAESVAEALRERPVVTATGYHWRNLDTLERARAALRDNPARLVMAFWLDTTPQRVWWPRRECSGGQIVEQATHILDLARALIGEVTEVFGAAARTDRPAYPDTDVDDVSAATLRFASGAVGSLASTCLLGPRCHPQRASLHVIAEGLTLELSEDVLTIGEGADRQVFQARGDAKVMVDRYFIEAVQGRPNCVRAPYAEALRTHRLACTIDRSTAEGQPLRVAHE